MSRALEHIGFIGVYLVNPAFVVTVTAEAGLLGTYGFNCCSEQELCDFVQFRSALLLKRGRFDRQLAELQVTVVGSGRTWYMRYNENEFNFEMT